MTLSKAGHQVVAGMRGTRGKNQAVARELAALPNIDVVDMDVTDDQSVNNAVRSVLDKYGKIDVLVNNAGVAGFGVLEGYTLEQVRKLFEVNFYGVLRTYQAVLPAMRAAKDGLVINISTGVKAGLNADKADVVAAYGLEATDRFNAMGQAMFGKMAEFKMDPQTIADGILSLVNQQKGTRPLRFPLDAIAQGADQEFVDARVAIKAKWAKNYGIAI